ncbi:MAG: alpha/beta hydrolase [Bacteroidia bacterium]|nr:alpha/beta hydrolase [Bacteroidia bacterium]
MGFYQYSYKFVQPQRVNMIKTALYKNQPVTFSDKGKGRVVVLLHGFLGSQAIWKPLSDNLCKSYRVIAIDLPGHGATPCFGYAHSMDLMARCVKSVLDSLHLKRYVIIGHSMGGYVALAFADLFPEHLRGFCLYHSTAYPDSEEKKHDRLRAIEVVKANKNVYTRNTIRNLFAERNLKYMKEEVAFAYDIARKTSKQGIIAALHGMRDRPNRHLILGFVRYPIMMVIGELDNVLPYEQLLEQAEMIENKTILYLEYDGHFGFLESPKVSNRALRSFLRKSFK